MSTVVSVGAGCFAGAAGTATVVSSGDAATAENPPKKPAAIMTSAACRMLVLRSKVDPRLFIVMSVGARRRRILFGRILRDARAWRWDATHTLTAALLVGFRASMKWAHTPCLP
jgi:hypothetical protein